MYSFVFQICCNLARNIQTKKITEKKFNTNYILLLSFFLLFEFFRLDKFKQVTMFSQICNSLSRVYLFLIIIILLLI